MMNFYVLHESGAINFIATQMEFFISAAKLSIVPQL